ncbi:hypothetical protein D3C77_524140 [compost metagenome]
MGDGTACLAHEASLPRHPHIVIFPHLFWGRFNDLPGERGRFISAPERAVEKGDRLARHRGKPGGSSTRVGTARSFSFTDASPGIRHERCRNMASIRCGHRG